MRQKLQKMFNFLRLKIFFLSFFRRNSESEVAAAAKGGSRKTSLSRDSSRVFYYCFESPIHITASSASVAPLLCLSNLPLLFPEQPSRSKKKMSKNTDPFENIAITLERF